MSIPVSRCRNASLDSGSRSLNNVSTLRLSPHSAQFGRCLALMETLRRAAPVRFRVRPIRAAEKGEPARWGEGPLAALGREIEKALRSNLSWLEHELPSSSRPSGTSQRPARKDWIATQRPVRAVADRCWSAARDLRRTTLSVLDAHGKRILLCATIIADPLTKVVLRLRVQERGVPFWRAIVRRDRYLGRGKTATPCANPVRETFLRAVTISPSLYCGQ